MDRLTAVAVVVLAHAVLAQAPTTIQLEPGSKKVIQVPGLQRVAVGDATVADVKPIGNGELLLTGLSPGHTTVIVRYATGQKVSYDVEVRAQATTEGLTGADAGEEMISVKRGHSTALSVPKLERVAIGDAETADIVPTDAGLTIKGLKVGVTTLLLWHADGRRSAFRVVVQP